MSDKYQVVAPPKEIFKNAGFQMEPAKRVVGEMSAYIFDHMDFPEEGGMYAWFKDCPYPAKGFPFPQFINALNGAKRFFKRGLDALTSKKMLFPMIGFLLSPSKKGIIEEWLSAFSDSSLYILDPYLLDTKRYSVCPLEIRIFIINFLTKLGIDKEITARFAEVFSLFIQGDDAYRIRVEDLFSETTKEKMLKNPEKEIERLIDILMVREPNAVLGEGNVGKFSKIAKLFKYLMFVPKFRKAFRYALEQSHFENFQLDDADKYHSLLRDDYNIMGYSTEDRIEFYKLFHTVFPPFPPRTIVKLA